MFLGNGPLSSREPRADALLKNKTWLSGSEYLLHPEQDWPVNPNHTSKLLPDDPEVRVSVTVKAVHTVAQRYQKLRPVVISFLGHA